MAIIVLCLVGLILIALTVVLGWALLDLIINIINPRGYYEEYTKHKTILYVSKPDSANTSDVVSRL